MLFGLAVFDFGLDFYTIQSCTRSHRVALQPENHPLKQLIEVRQHSAHCSTLAEVPCSLALPGTVPFNFTRSLVLLALTPIHYGAKGLSQSSGCVPCCPPWPQLATNEGGQMIIVPPYAAKTKDLSGDDLIWLSSSCSMLFSDTSPEGATRTPLTFLSGKMTVSSNRGQCVCQQCAVAPHIYLAGSSCS